MECAITLICNTSFFGFTYYITCDDVECKLFRKYKYKMWNIDQYDNNDTMIAPQLELEKT